MGKGTSGSFWKSRLFLNRKIFNAGTWLGVFGREWTGIASGTETMNYDFFKFNNLFKSHITNKTTSIV
jgi:hypothetical protein